MTKYEEMVSKIVPDPDMIPWLQRQGYLCEKALIYKKEYIREPITGEKSVACRCICSACRATFYESYVAGCACGRGYSSVPYGVMIGREIMKEGSTTNCPECGELVKVMYDGYFSHYSPAGKLINCEYVQELRVIEGLPVLLEWRCDNGTTRDGDHWNKANLSSAFLFEQRKAVRLSGSGNFMGNYYIKNFLNETKRCVDDLGRITHMMPVTPGLLNGTSLENAKLEEYLQCEGELYPVSYLRLYQQKHKVETLLTSGAGKLLAELIREEWNSQAGYNGRCCQRIPKLIEVKWKEERPSAMLGLNRGELRRMVTEEWDLDDWRAYIAVRDKSGLRLCKEDLKQLDLDDAVKIMDMGLPLLKTVRYLKKQKQTVFYLRDYLQMAEKIEYDIRDPVVIYPKSLKEAHDRVMQLQKEREREELRQKFRDRREFLASLSWEHEGIMIRPVEDQKELIDEGKTLKHCVATYAKRHSNGECSILLIRKAEEPGRPWYTLNFNVSTGTVTENRGSRNCDRTEEVRAFEAAWLKAKEKEIRKLQRAAKKGKENIA